MEELIMKFKSRYDLEAVKAYNKYNLYSKLTYKIVTVLAIILIIASIVIKMELPLRIAACGVGIVWILEIILLPGIRAKNAMKSSKLSRDSIVEVEFKEANIFMITKRKEDIIGTSIINYEDVYKICNTKNYIYVYISDNQAILCSKKNMKGDYKKFTTFLKKKIGKRYKGE